MGINHPDCPLSTYDQWEIEQRERAEERARDEAYARDLAELERLQRLEDLARDQTPAPEYAELDPLDPRD